QTMLRILRKHLHNKPKARVLIIDDDADIRARTRRELSEESIDVVEAVDGQDGLEKAIAVKPDLILLDLVMPRMDGFEFISEYGKSVDNPPPIVVLTAKDLSSEERTFLNAHATRVLHKDGAQPQKLADALHEVLVTDARSKI